eukprot:Skav227285  [mRNA]  locus=scaffold4796:46576:49949:+ [translate_table: standard]
MFGAKKEKKPSKEATGSQGRLAATAGELWLESSGGRGIPFYSSRTAANASCLMVLRESGGSSYNTKPAFPMISHDFHLQIPMISTSFHVTGPALRNLLRLPDGGRGFPGLRGREVEIGRRVIAVKEMAVGSDELRERPKLQELREARERKKKSRFGEAAELDVLMADMDMEDDLHEDEPLLTPEPTEKLKKERASGSPECSLEILGRWIPTEIFNS